jgi:hypothetical protein
MQRTITFFLNIIYIKVDAHFCLSLKNLFKKTLRIVPQTFLNGRLTEDIYNVNFTCQPPGFAAEGQANKICKLKKNFYGLKKATIKKGHP